MKNELYKLIFFISVFLFSCNHDTKNTALRSGDKYKLINYPEHCFIAIYQKDSAFLKFKTMPNGKIYGKLVIKYSERQSNNQEKEFDHGEIIGQFKKDTLFADYIFADGTKRTHYRNPIALLKKGPKLVLGFGAIGYYVGKSWFINHKAINFTRSRFQFLPTECAN
ncbi:hypothetical protein [Mucilaginibacter sp.]|uniref:hypothetical protein n=1 Tax=Mucilaginibacter sp. TaxID=1882438 RepID=UPI0026129B3E|nr:hypothetical protein [Mucilaginibacter sp.]MDB4919669.1 hypothetical protein [Mucilaginibacter sp.]